MVEDRAYVRGIDAVCGFALMSNHPSEHVGCWTSAMSRVYAELVDDLNTPNVVVRAGEVHTMMSTNDPR